MDSFIKCPFCKSPFAAADLVQHCKECPSRRNSLQRPLYKPDQGKQQTSPQSSIASTAQNAAPRAAVQAKPFYEQNAPAHTFELKQIEQADDALNNSTLFTRYRSPQSQRTARQEYARGSTEKSQQEDYPEEQPVEAVDLAPCPICGRQFDKSRIEKHKYICQRSGSRKVKKFDVNEKKFAALSQEEQRLVHPESQQEIAERKKEVEKIYSTTFQKKDNLNGSKEVQLFGQQKPNFQPYSDNEDDDQAQRQAKQKATAHYGPVKEFVPPESGPIDEVSNMHIGGPRLQRTPTEERKYESPYKVKQFLEEQDAALKKKGLVYNTPTAEKKQEQIPYQPQPPQQISERPSMQYRQEPSKHKHRHKHRHEKKEGYPKGDVMQYMQQMMYMMQMMQMYQQNGFNSLGMHSMPVHSYPVYQAPQHAVQLYLPPSQFQTQPYQAVAASNMPFCVNCGGKYVEGARFCGFCGGRRE